MRTRVKICGITRIDDALAAADAGVDAIGLVFAEASPRYVDIGQATAIVETLPPFVTVVGLFVDAPSGLIREVLSRVNLHLLQFHGKESPQQCRLYGLPYIKAIAMENGVDVHEEARRYGDASALLLDTYVSDRAGGSGRSFDWARVPADVSKPIVLAGGLTAENVRAAIMAVHPSAVDVSSGVEQAKGIKDPKKIAAFMQAVRAIA